VQLTKDGTPSTLNMGRRGDPRHTVVEMRATAHLAPRPRANLSAAPPSVAKSVPQPSPTAIRQKARGHAQAAASRLSGERRQGRISGSSGAALLVDRRECAAAFLATSPSIVLAWLPSGTWWCERDTALHSPLMSDTNANSRSTHIGALVQVVPARSRGVVERPDNGCGWLAVAGIRAHLDLHVRRFAPRTRACWGCSANKGDEMSESLATVSYIGATTYCSSLSLAALSNPMHRGAAPLYGMIGMTVARAGDDLFAATSRTGGLTVIIAAMLDGPPVGFYAARS